MRANGFVIPVVTLGSMVRSFTSAPFTDADGVPVDPTSVSVRVDGPGGYSQTFVYGTDAELITTGTGLYQLEFAPELLGFYKGRWIASEPEVADETFEVWVTSRFAPPPAVVP